MSRERAPVRVRAPRPTDMPRMRGTSGGLGGGVGLAVPRLPHPHAITEGPVRYQPLLQVMHVREDSK